MWDEPDAVGIDGYLARGGYEGLRAAVQMSGQELIELVKTAGLRGRGGAGFPTGVKWSFVPQDTGKPTYLVCNFDESEPGTCNNREIVERTPHLLVEGVVIAARAIGCTHAFIYTRGEYLWQATLLERAVREAEAKGFVGENILGSGSDVKVTVFRGAGAYICGEETALLNSLEGLRGQPRLRPPFPAVEGLYSSPTAVNNVETLANVPLIVARGAEWFASIGTEKSPGTKLFTLSGKVERPGNYEFPMGTTFREVLDAAGGVKEGKGLKAWTPGGSSTPFLTDEHLDVGLDFESVAAAGSLLGTGALQVLDETDCVVEATRRWMEFYAHESCGKCTPCREGTWWMTRVLGRVEQGFGQDRDIPVMEDAGSKILFRSFCALADGAVSPLQSSLKFFRPEYEEHIRLGRCPMSGAPTRDELEEVGA
ncbi:MAG: NADH-quinone oxidoreductase subunit NuoF [Actinomycetota bacterium]